MITSCLILFLGFPLFWISPNPFSQVNVERAKKNRSYREVKTDINTTAQ